MKENYIYTNRLLSTALASGPTCQVMIPKTK